MSDYIIYNGELYHFGVQGMKWGVRRYQNIDGTLNSAGRKRYADLSKKRLSTAYKIKAVEDRKQKITDRYNKHAVANARRDVKLSIYKQKRDSLQPKVSKITTKMMVKGKSPNFFEKRTLKKAYKLDKRIANASKSKDRFNKQISKLDLKSARLQKHIAKYNRKILELDNAQIDLGRKFSKSFSSMTPEQLTAYRKEHARDRQAYLNERQKDFVQQVSSATKTWNKSNNADYVYQTTKEDMKDNPLKYTNKRVRSKAEREMALQKETSKTAHDEFVKANNKSFETYSDIRRTVSELNKGPYEVKEVGEGRKKKYRVSYKE